MRMMKFFVVAFVILALSSCANNSVTNKELNSKVDSVSYAIGVNMASQMRISFTEVNEDLFIQGFKNGLDSSNLKIEVSKVNGIVRDYMMKKQMAEQKKQQEENLKKIEVEFADVKKAGENFLVENKTKEGVQTTESGLQYIVLKEGAGEKPSGTSRVKVHYHGTLTDGTVFDSSVERGKPSEFGVNGVIKGWTEGLQLMPVGSKYKFFIPQELAYGAFPRQGGKVRPFDALVFEVELVEIVKK